MWYPMEYKAWALRGILAATGLLSALPASSAVIDVCAACTHTTLDTAFAAATANDIIVLDGPDDPLDPADVYTLGTNLVIDATKDGLRIRGKSTARPDKIVIQGTGTGPVITVEQGFTFEALGVTISGGSTGILAMQDSNVDIRRCLIDGISGVGVDCSNPEEVYIAGSVIQGSGGDAVRLDLGGELNMTQCTLLSNTGLGVNAIGGVATVASCLIHDSGAGLDGTVTSLTVGGNWVTDAAGVVLPMPAGVTDAYAIPDVLDPLVTFEQDANAFPGEIDDLFTLPLTGQTAATLSDVTPLGRDFENVLRNTSDPRPGAHENGLAATLAAWIECEIIQRGDVRSWVGEGPVTIELYVENISLENGRVWIANPTASGRALGDVTPPTPNQLDLGIVQTPSQVDKSFGWVDYVIERDVFEAGFQNIPVTSIDNATYEIYVQPFGVFIPDTAILDQPEAAGSQAEVGRVFGLDTSPPTVRVVAALADQYLTSADDLSGIDLDRPTGWGTSAFAGLINNVGANANQLDGRTGDPQVFFDGTVNTYIPLDMNSLAFGVRVIFDDVGSGFQTVGLPTAAGASLAADKDALLYETYADLPGMAWWARNTESDLELINTDNNPTLSVTYTVPPSGTEMEARWEFSDALYGPNQWHAIANIRVMDLAGNEATLDPSFQTVVPLRPLHLWWLPIAQAEFRDGPSGASEENPVFTWGLHRFNGQEPQDTNPCPPSARFYIFKVRTAADGPGAALIDISGGWSEWLGPLNRNITLDTFHTSGTTVRELIDNARNPAADKDRQYIMVLQGYDEAGNLQRYPDGSAVPASFGPMTGVPSDPLGGTLAWMLWTDPGVSASAGLDTRIQPIYWHDSDGNRALDGGEKSFGAARRIPLPAVEVACGVQVSAGFSIEMSATDTVTAGGRIAFRLYEDGALAVEGEIDPSTVPAGPYTLVLPQDLFLPHLTINAGGLSFLNPTPCDPLLPVHLGDDGEPGSESDYRKRDVKYQLLCATGVFDTSSGNWVYDTTPASVEFTVTVDRGLKDDQPIKSFSKE